MQKMHIDYGLHLWGREHISGSRALMLRNGRTKMKPEVTYRTATPEEVSRIIARAHAERSAFIAAFAAKTGARLRGLFHKTPSGAAAA
jgi:hypothetical protein